jgi:hypothetical protein
MSEKTETYDIEITPGGDDPEDPVPVTIFGDGLVIFDPIEFAAVYNCHAAKMVEGVLFVLCRESNRWRRVDPVNPLTVC